MMMGVMIRIYLKLGFIQKDMIQMGLYIQDNLVMKELAPIIQSVSDTRKYKIIQLENGLECIIISDPDTKKASASLSVGVGSLQDPVEVQGIAHYLEHMLFMGTKKYPDENIYSEEISKNSGSSNAYTSQNETNYHFEVACLSFRQILDMFAQFFVEPLMNQSSSERELEAVHSEHSKNIQQDAWRKFQLLKHSSRAGEPFSKFSTGDKNSLSVPNVRQALLKFYNEKYSSNLMKLVVYSDQSVEDMAKCVQELFSPVVNKNYSQYRLPNPPFDESNLNNLYKIVPIKNKKIIEYLWMVSNQEQHYENAPGDYISFLIGHEGENSLLSLLIKEGLAYQLSSGSCDEYHSYTEYSVTITLTDKGFENHQLVTEYLFYYIQMLKTKGVQKWIFEEIKHIRDIKFKTMSMSNSMSFSSKLAKRMHNVPLQEVLIFDYLYKDWKPELIHAYLQQMVPQNLRVNISSPSYQGQTDQTEPIYGTQYSVEKLETITPRECAVDLPPPNIFFPDNMDLIPESNIQYPAETLSNDRIKVFYKADNRFKLPKGEVNLRLCYKNSDSVRDQVEKCLYLQLLKNHLRQIDYMAETAYLTTTLSFSAFGLDLQIEGFNNSIEKFVKPYLNKILDFTPDNEQLFNDLKVKKTLAYQNFFKQIPYKIAYQYHLLAVRDGLDSDPSEKLREIQLVTFHDIVAFSKQWKSELYAELFVSGNFTQQSALEISRLVESKLKECSKPLSVNRIRALRGVDIEPGKIKSIEHLTENLPAQTNSCLMRYYQTTPTTVRDKVVHDLLVNFLYEPTFNYLRTIESLGYIVTCVSVDGRGMLGLSFLVQSSVKSSHQLGRYIDKLIVVLNDKISSLTQETFKPYRDSLYVSKSQKPKTLGDQSKKFWEEIVKHSYVFNRREQELQVIEKLTLQEFKGFYESAVKKNPKSFETHLVAECHVTDNETERATRESEGLIERVHSIQEFKKTNRLLKDYYAHK